MLRVGMGKLNLAPSEFWRTTRAELKWRHDGMFPEATQPNLAGLWDSMKELEEKHGD